jgi:hypothetical protein
MRGTLSRGRTTFAAGRKLTSAVRAGRRPTFGDVTPRRDPALLDVVDRPFVDAADAHARLAELEHRLVARDDRRSVFLTVYVRVTEEVRRGVDAAAFEDPAWVESYLVTFADHYRRAFAAFERGDADAVPPPWRLSFERALADDALVVQHVLLGVNAHVNYDLALALHEVGIDPDREAKRADHRAINRVLGRLVDEEQALVAERYAAGVADVDEALGRVDEALSLFTLREGRRNAWYGAVALTDGRLRQTRRVVDWVLRSLSVGAGYFVLSPSLSPALMRRLEAVERGDDPE